MEIIASESYRWEGTSRGPGKSEWNYKHLNISKNINPQPLKTFFLVFDHSQTNTFFLLSACYFVCSSLCPLPYSCTSQRSLGPFCLKPTAHKRGRHRLNPLTSLQCLLERALVQMQQLWKTNWDCQRPSGVSYSFYFNSATVWNNSNLHPSQAFLYNDAIPWYFL